MTEIASDTYMTVLYQSGRKWKKRTDFWRYFDIWGESWGACARQDDKCVPYIAGWRRKRLIRPTNTNPASRCSAGRQMCAYIAGWRRKRLIRPIITNPASRCAAGRQMCAIHCRMAAKTPYPAYKHKPGVAMCGRATNVCRTLPDGGENALSGL